MNIAQISSHPLRRVLYFTTILFLYGCGGGSGSSVNSTPTTPAVRSEAFVMATSPANDIALVNVSEVLQITFDNEIDMSMLSNAFVITDNIQGRWNFDSGSLIATFTPQEPLTYSKTYAVTLNSTPQSETGKVLGGDYNWTFTTQGEPVVKVSKRGGVAILDLSVRNAASYTSTKALIQAMDIMGQPYIVTEQLSEAIDYPVIYTSSFVSPTTFIAADKSSLTEYVQNGGVLVATSLSDPELYSLFGISAQIRENMRYELLWDTDTTDPALTYIDDVIETTSSLASSDSIYLYTRSYTLSGASELATYNDGTSAIAKNSYGNGHTYLLGLSYSNIILRNQMNLDYNAGSGALNEFEPTTDTFMLFLRAIYENNAEAAIWKHTSPGLSQSSLIVTHDVDSQSAADWMAAFIDMETDNNVSATYNINTHYIDDFNDNDYYSMNLDIYSYALEKGHVISSHSVGHFRDFGDEDIVPLGNPGNTFENYNPQYNGVTTLDATVYGELEVSKALLENDLSTEVKTFRTGHLAWNDFQVTVLEELGYRFDSSFSGSNVLTYFPYRLQYNSSLKTELSSIYEFPLAISDSNSAYGNVDGAVAVWLEVLGKNNNNGAPSVLLVHPNREFKLLDLESFIEQLPSDVLAMNMDEFGQFWVIRDEFDFKVTIENKVMTITLDENHTLPLNADVSLIIKGGVDLSAVNIVSINGTSVNYIATKDGNNIKLHSFALN